MAATVGFCPTGTGGGACVGLVAPVGTPEGGGDPAARLCPLAPNGEWAKPRVLQVQFQNIRGNDPMQFKDTATQVVVSPPEYASGKFVYPYETAK